jgi:signal transduction histidine kinase
VRLIALVGATSSLVLVAFLIPLALLVRSAAADRAVSVALVEIQALAPVVATSSDDTSLSQAVTQANREAVDPITVFLPNGLVLGASAPRSDAVRRAESGQSLAESAPGGREVVIAVGGLPDGTAVIRTFVTDDQLSAGVGQAWLVLALLGLGLLVVSLVVADQLARNLIRPMTSAANVAYRLAHGSLGARAPDEGPPELRQVSAGLNFLAGRIIELLAHERATVADLSHRLRTPLTALRIDVESLVDPGLRDRLMADLDAVDRTVDAVIREADRPVRVGVDASCDAVAVVRERVGFWSVLAEDEHRRVTVDLPGETLPVSLAVADLAACVDALVGNVFAHTPEGTAFTVRLVPNPSGTVAGAGQTGSGGAVLVVSDSGGGLGAAAVERGVSGRGSTGLGLDIVARSAKRSGGTLRLGRSSAGGAEITVALGGARPPTVRSHRERHVAASVPRPGSLESGPIQ